MSVKSKVAAEFSIVAMCQRNKTKSGRFRGYLWTFTFPRPMAVKEGSLMWAKLVNKLMRHCGFAGIRCYELHETHGLHIHVVTDLRYPVTRIREFCLRHGFGRVHVKVVSAQGVLYVAKYLGKQRGSGWSSRVRLFAVFGGVPSFRPWQSRVRDIEVDSDVHRLYRFLRDNDGCLSSARWRVLGTDFQCLVDRWRGDALFSRRLFALARVLHYHHGVSVSDGKLLRDDSFSIDTGVSN